MIAIDFNIEISSEFGRKVSQLEPKENLVFEGHVYILRKPNSM
jgi:hypothetical protein